MSLLDVFRPARIWAVENGRPVVGVCATCDASVYGTWRREDDPVGEWP